MHVKEHGHLHVRFTGPSISRPFLVRSLSVTYPSLICTHNIGDKRIAENVRKSVTRLLLLSGSHGPHHYYRSGTCNNIFDFINNNKKVFYFIKDYSLFSSPEQSSAWAITITTIVRRPSVRPSVCPSVRASVRASTIASNDISSWTAWPMLMKLCRNVPWVNLYQSCSNRSGPLII